MIKIKKVLSLILVGVIAATSLVCGSVTAGALDKYAEFTGKYNNKGQFIINIFVGETPYSQGLINSAYDSVRTDPKTDAVVHVCLLSDGKMCYGFLILEGNEKYYYPVEIPEEKIEDKLSLSSFKTIGNKGLDMKVTTQLITKRVAYQTYKLGISYTLDPTTESGAYFMEKLKGCKKGYYALLISKREKLYTLDDSYITYSEFKPNIIFDEYSEPDLEDHSKISITALKIGTIADQTYTGKKITPDVKLTVNTDYTLKKGKDYTLTYKNNKNIGKASVTIKMIGDFTGSKTLTFNIVPKTTTLKASKTSSKFKLSWSKVSGIDGYQIQYSPDGGSTYENAGKFSASKKSCTLNLDTSRKQIFRIRTYKVVNGVTYYSKWSKTVTVKK